MLAQGILGAVHSDDPLPVASHAGKQQWSMAFPIARITMPDNLASVAGIHACNLGSTAAYLQCEEVILQFVGHSWWFNV